MPNPLPANRLSFEENISTLLEELVLAGQWQRPSLLLAVHKSKLGQEKAEKALQERLEKLGQRVIHIKVDQEQSDIPHIIAGTTAPAGSVFFVSNLDWGGGEDRQDAYRALNIYRELFVDHHIRAVFWLTTHEAATLARFAPDFWAFRHRVIEFTGQRIPRKVQLPAGVLLWDMQNLIDPYDTLEARIAVREELLAKLPGSSEARSARVDLLHNLGYLYWSRGDSDRASQLLAEGLGLLREEPAGRTRSMLLNSQAVVAYDAGHFDRAAGLLEAALKDSPDDASLLINLSAASTALGRNQEALTIARKAVKAGPRDARIWSTLGYIYAATGKYDEAIAAFGKAAELAPRAPGHHLALAICYDLVERGEECMRQLALARQLLNDGGQPYVDICEAALVGDAARAIELARAAIRDGRISAVDLRRDPGLSLVMDAHQRAQIAA